MAHHRKDPAGTTPPDALRRTSLRVTQSFMEEERVEHRSASPSYNMGLPLEETVASIRPHPYPDIEVGRAKGERRPAAALKTDLEIGAASSTCWSRGARRG